MPPSHDSEGKGKFEEADVEGMDFAAGYLWLAGSHRLNRKKVDNEDSEEEGLPGTPESWRRR